jgi:hypothetical protein
MLPFGWQGKGRHGGACRSKPWRPATRYQSLSGKPLVIREQKVRKGTAHPISRLSAPASVDDSTVRHRSPRPYAKTCPRTMLAPAAKAQSA